MSKPLRVVNLFAGPGTGKSTTCAALFAELKYRGCNTEMVLEYAKDAAWEKRGAKVFKAQEYIFGKQHFRLSRVAEEVDFVVTDSPVLMSTVYIPDDHHMPSLSTVIREAHDNYENINIFISRSPTKKYNPKGRNQDEAGAMDLDTKIRQMLISEGLHFYTIPFSREAVDKIIEIMDTHDWFESGVTKLIKEPFKNSPLTPVPVITPLIKEMG